MDFKTTEDIQGLMYPQKGVHSRTRGSKLEWRWVGTQAASGNPYDSPFCL